MNESINRKRIGAMWALAFGSVMISLYVGALPWLIALQGMFVGALAMNFTHKEIERQKIMERLEGKISD